MAIDTIRAASCHRPEQRYISKVIRQVRNWTMRRLEIRRSRIALLELSESQLRDIGLRREDATVQGNLPWWR
ncbi:MAG: DUF1127 domain-containing protein [Rhizobiaceae bacterium]|nr:DUF1127 domain-containing protein [Rhizobiaceae bacterium]